MSAGSGLVGKTPRQLRENDVVLLDDERWRVLARTRVVLGYAYVHFEHADPAPGQRAARFGRQYPAGHSFTVEAR